MHASDRRKSQLSDTSRYLTYYALSMAAGSEEGETAGKNDPPALQIRTSQGCLEGSWRGVLGGSSNSPSPPIDEAVGDCRSSAAQNLPSIPSVTRSVSVGLVPFPNRSFILSSLEPPGP
ncbi:uncharacterized protein BO80DRAFT_128456 [Aspergillus ibericus CBS 121593]|uniref:Uncharacterized protein n=1 Tax=Aspergillus ibericus CBS 121593 TaxID=1448316 RepID=A0A395GVD4_9EURO|nr:hypothetical protein BO80DRAFT_128456 [Aspergillus ibericus CBS 121593]RAK99352.1 hypothetical protein BO80DRAFT_128456 [Aspergillus ibericus CBS 121593]